LRKTKALVSYSIEYNHNTSPPETSIIRIRIRTFRLMVVIIRRHYFHLKKYNRMNNAMMLIVKDFRRPW